MGAESFVSALLKGFSQAVQPVTGALTPLAASPPSFDALASLLSEFGWTLAAGSDAHAIETAFGTLSSDINTLASDAQQLAADSSADEITVVVSDLAHVIADIENLSADFSSLSFAPFNQNDFLTSFPQQLWPYLVHQFLRSQVGTIYGMLRFLGVLTETPQPAVAASGRAAYLKRDIDWSRIPQYASRPGATFAGVYHWGDPSTPLDHAALIQGLGALFGAFPLASGVNAPPGEVLPLFYPGTVPPGLLQLNASPVPPFDMSGPLDIMLKLILGVLPVPVPGGTPPDPVGLAMFPIVTGEAAASFTVTDTFKVGIDGQFQSIPVIVEFRPSASTGIDTQVNKVTLNALGNQTDVSGTVTLTATAPSGTPWILIGDASASHVELAGAHVGVNAAGPLTAIEYKVDVGLDALKLVIDLSDADGFLQTMVGSGPQAIDLSFAVEWSRQSGFAFSGQAQLTATIPLHLTIAGVLQVDTVSVAVTPGSDGSSAAVAVGVTGGLTLGPVAVSVDKVGLQLGVKSAAPGTGNLGDLDLQFGFKPPDGLGLAVDASVASGGGYIFLDPQKGEYAGIFVIAVDLPILTMQVNVAGILDTKLPDGSPGFSLLFLLVATFDPGFELGFGFTLNGVGGLVGINRSMAFDPLRAAFKSHQLETIFFPPDAETAIANAPQTISDLSAIFPVTEGHTVFGPVLALGWGTPGIVSAEFGGILELPSFRLALFGFFSVGLPSLEEPDPTAILILLNIDILGEIDFQQQQLSIDGDLYDSHVVDFALTGQMALRLTWGATPAFALSVGGFNPQFQPPAGFPSLQRLMLSLNSSDVSLSLSAYFAVTSNSLQVGANLEVHASAAGFTVHGYLGFDVLFTKPPFAFAADMSADVDVLQGSSVLLSISLDLTLTGPKPFHIHGDGSFHVLFFNVNLPIDKTIGDPGQAPPLPATNVWPLLQEALQDPRNWSTTLPEGIDHAVSFAQVPTGGQVILVHPAGRLTVREKVVPLNFPFSLFGSAAPGDYGEFDVNAAHAPTLDGTAAPFEIQQDYFAPGQFEQGLSDQDKLSKPSYQLFDAVISFGPTAITSGDDSVLDVHYETYYVENPNIPASQSPLTYRLDVPSQLALAAQSASALSPAWHTGGTKYVVPGSKSSITTSDLGYVIASSDTLRLNSGLSVPGGTSQAIAEAALQAHLGDHPEDAGSFQVVPAHEAIP
jgi:hypothetical protein